MREWNKPEITESEAGMEVTSYLPAELDRAQDIIQFSVYVLKEGWAFISTLFFYKYVYENTKKKNISHIRHFLSPTRLSFPY